MRNKVPLISTIDKRLNVSLLIAFMCVVAVEFVFDNTTELFSGGAKLGDILSNLSLAFVASYIFYVVVVHMKYVKDKEHLDPYIALKSRQLINSIRVLTHQLLINAGDDVEIEYPEKQKLDEITKKSKMSDPAPRAYTRISPSISTMSDFFYHWQNLGEERLSDILSCSQYLESDHIKLLLRIQESSLYSTLNTFKEIKIDQDFSFLSGDLLLLSQSAKNLEKYCDINYSETPNY